MSTALLESCWNALRLLAQAIKESPHPIAFCSLRFGAGETVRINALGERPGADSFLVTLLVDPSSPRLPQPGVRGGAWFRLCGVIHLVELTSGGLPEDVQQMLRVYAPYCFAPIYAQRWQRAFAVSHFAQSLDGRIATSSGDSKWIGGPANRRHAHRMRALCDGILIGTRTLARDAPQLTVREVPGRNPTRIVVGTSVENTDSLTQASADPILLIGTPPLPRQASSTVVTLRRDAGFFSGVQILEALYQQGIYSVYIEGGAITTSHFLQERCLDVVQLHIAPMVLGSGIPAFSLPAIPRVTDALRFVSSLYVPVDDGMMFIGTLR